MPKSSKQVIFFLLTILSAFLISKFLNINYISFSTALLYNNFLFSYFYTQVQNLKSKFNLISNDDEEKVQLDLHLSSIFNKMVNIADQPLKKYKVAVGFGSCVDIFTDAIPLFESLNFEPPISKPKHYKVINNHKELTSGFSYFFTRGAASERYVSDDILFDKIVNQVDKINPNAKYALGGNAPVMANRLAKEGKLNNKQISNGDIILAAQHSFEFNKNNWMDEVIKFTGPKTNVADRHLILEYKTNEKFGNKLRSPRANRFIIHSDVHNPYLTGIDKNFELEFIKMNPDLLIISGLQMMDNIPYKSREERNGLIKKISEFCKEHRETKTHFELASFVDQELVNEIIKEIIPYSDSIGCNEQELPNIYNALSGKELITVADSMPKVANILDILRQTFQILQTQKSISRPTSRIHVHTLAYQAIIQLDDEATEKMWPNIRQSAAKASVTAVRHICQNDQVNENSIKILLDNSFRTSAEEGNESDSNPKRIFIDKSNPIACWKENDPVIGKRIQICLAVGLVCTEVKQTAGGGDNISASALAAQLP